MHEYIELLRYLIFTKVFSSIADSKLTVDRKDNRRYNLVLVTIIFFFKTISKSDVGLKEKAPSNYFPPETLL